MTERWAGSFREGAGIGEGSGGYVRREGQQRTVREI